MSKLDILTNFTNEELIQALKRRDVEYLSPTIAKRMTLPPYHAMEFSNHLGVHATFFNGASGSRSIYFEVLKDDE